MPLSSPQGDKTMKELTKEVMKCDGATDLQKVFAFMDDNKDTIKKLAGVVVTVDDKEDYGYGDDFFLTFDEAVTKIFELDIATHYEVKAVWICEKSDWYGEDERDIHFKDDHLVLNILNNDEDSEKKRTDEQKVVDEFNAAVEELMKEGKTRPDAVGEVMDRLLKTGSLEKIS